MMFLRSTPVNKQPSVFGSSRYNHHIPSAKFLNIARPICTMDLNSLGVADSAWSRIVVSDLSKVKCFSTMRAPRAIAINGTSMPTEWSLYPTYADAAKSFGRSDNCHGYAGYSDLHHRYLIVSEGANGTDSSFHIPSEIMVSFPLETISRTRSGLSTTVRDATLYRRNE